MAQARDRLGNKNKVLAVIGDGSLTAGLAFEGLNHAGALHTNFTVVLNDNKMSISHNVGAMSQYLNRVITGKWYNRFRSEVDPIVTSIVGDGVANFARRMEEGIKGAIVPGRLFEDLGFKYIGPIDGHELPYLIETFQGVHAMTGPKLVHVVTTKGKGYAPAEEKSKSFHGVSPFHPDTGLSKKGKGAQTYTEVFSEALIAEAHADERIVAITAAMPDGTGLDAFAQIFPERFFDVGIAEPHAVTFAGGLASEGLKPVVAIYSTFLQRSYDQILHDVCLMNLDVTFAVDRAGIVGEDGATHQGLFDLSYLRTAPNLLVMAPKDEGELRAMVKTAIAHPGPAAVRYPRGAGIGTGIDETAVVESIPIGEAEVLTKGNDLALVAIGSSVLPAIEAAAVLENEGYAVTVVNGRFVKPLDEKTICDVARRCGMIVTVEENVLAGGFGSALLEALEQNDLSHILVKRIGVKDSFVEHAPQAVTRTKRGLDAAGIAHTARQFLKQNGRSPATSDLTRPKIAASGGR
jgi:1-deoxy-D-xylulose-5-phosphate synthase